MNKLLSIVTVVSSLALSYVILIFAPLPYLAAVAALPLFALGWKRSLLMGFLIGFASSLSLYLIYPLADVLKLSYILAGIVSLPQAVVLLAFPLFFGLIFAFSGMLWSEVAFNISTARSGSKSGDGVR